jgi:hypothetical protein
MPISAAGSILNETFERRPMHKLTSLALLVGTSLTLAACSQMPSTYEASPSPMDDSYVDTSTDTMYSPMTSPMMSPDTGTTGTMDAMMQAKFIALNEQNDLGQSGKAELTENADGKVVVTLTMVGGTFTQPQPAHIHVGSCPTPGAVKYPLSNVVNGKSVTTLAVSMSELTNSTEKLAINVHKSAAESSVYTACGDIK